MFSPPPSPVATKVKQDDSPNSKQLLPRSRGRGLMLVLTALVLVLIAATTRYVVHKGVGWNIGPVMEVTVSSGEDAGSWEETTFPRAKRRRDLSNLLDGMISAATSAPTGPAPAIPDPPFPVPNPFPQPFDVPLAYNFTTLQCYNFFTNFTQDSTFRTCRPLSLLLSSSNAFYESQSNLTTITATLGATCDTPTAEQQCIDNMEGFATQLQAQCGQDIMNRNSLVLEALNGFQSYPMYRKAGCLRNLRTNTYCYADALTPSSATDLYFFNLGFGVNIPRSAIPTCSACVQTLMTLYAGYAVDPTLLISETYAQGAQAAIKTCGANYAKIPEALHVATSGAQAQKSVPQMFSWLTAALFVLTWTVWS